MKKSVGLCLVALVFAGCIFDKKKDEIKSTPPDPSHGILVVTTSDFQSGEVRVIGLKDDSVMRDSVSIYQDNAARVMGGRIFILERYGASTLMEIGLSADLRVLSQVSLGDAFLNPQDIAEVSPGRFYISIQNGTSLLAGPAVGPFQSVNLAAYASPEDTAHFPNMDQMVMVGGKLYLAVQRGKNNPSGWGRLFDSAGLVLVINPARDSVERVIRLIHANPSGLAYADSAIYVITRGSQYVAGDGGIERIDLPSCSVSVVALENTFGADVLSIGDIAQRDGTRFYVALAHPWVGAGGNTQVALVDFKDGSVVHWLTPLTDAWGGLAYSRVDDKVCVGERGAQVEGVKIFSGTTGALLAGPISVGLAPYSMKVLE
jgi:hypothetical protein